MHNPAALASALYTDVDATITALNSKELINKVTKNKLETLLNEERNNVTTVLKSLDSIQQMLKLIKKQKINDEWWIDMVELVRHNERTKTIIARVKLASIKAIINKIRNIYNLVWTQPQPLLSTPLLHVPPPLQTPLQTQFLSVPPSLPPLRQSPSSLMEDNIKKWIKILEWVKKYIDEYKKRPTKEDKNEDVITHSAWISTQLTNYQKKEQIMSNETIRELWEDFINDDKYKKYFLSNEEVWKKNLEFVKKYIDENKKRPPQTSKNKNIKKHGQWLNNQLYNYKKQEQIMSNETIRYLWEDFINDDKYKEYFISNEEEWVIKLEWVKKYIIENKKRPSRTDKDKEIKKLGMWLCNQQQNYKNQQKTMSNKTIRHLWENFINDYKDYL
jgi:hypothetical protein